MTSFITRKGLKDRGITYSDGYLTKLESKGEFPKRTFLSPRKVAWVAEEVDAFIEGKIAARDTQPSEAA